MTSLKNYRIIYLSLFAFLIFSFSALAQTGKIKGRITDAITGDGMPIANVIIQGLARGAATDLNGKYEILAVKPGTYSLTFGYAGYADTTIHNVIVAVDSITYVNAVLRPLSDNTPIEVEFQKPEVTIDELRGGTAAPGVKLDSDYMLYAEDRTMPDEYWNTEEYAFNRENTFQDVLSDPFSTFSVDVDKASFTNLRRFLNRGQWPQEGVVRIEELINYFDYDYPEPEEDSPISLVTQLTDSPWNDNRILRIGIKSVPVMPEEMPLANFVFLFDVSGSMNAPNKLPLAKEALKMLVNQMRPEDRISIVTYASRTAVHLESTPGSQKEKIIHAIDILGAGGSTAGKAGITLAYEQAVNNYREGGNNRVILCTDGDFNVGVSSTAELTKMIEEKRDTGVFLSVLGFGYGNLKDNRLESLADNGNGNYAYIDNSHEARQYFVYEMAGNLLTVAKDVKVQVEFNPYHVRSYRLIGYENRMLEKKDFEDDKKDAGDLGAGQDVTALYEIVLNKSKEIDSKSNSKYTQQTLTDKAKSNEYATVNVRYKDANSKTSELIAKPLTKKYYIKFRKSDDSMKFSCAVAMFGMLLTKSEYSGSSSYDGILEIARSARGHDKMAKRADFIRLVEIAQRLSEKRNPDRPKEIHED